jgi:hypothetical protein
MNNLNLKKNALNLFKISIFAILLSDSGCTNHSAGSEVICIRNRQIIFESQCDSGFLLLPGKTQNIPFDFGKKDYPVRQKIRITGFGIFPEPFSRRGEDVFRKFSFHIDDYLDSTITYNEKYSLVFMGNGEKLERNAFYRLSEDELKPFKGKMIKVKIPVKTDNISIPENGYLVLELQLYMKKAGRHPDDIYDDADQIRVFQVPINYPDWHVLSGNVEIPENIACILFRLGSKDISGQCHFGTPWLADVNDSLNLLPFQPYRKEQKNWIGENLSTKEWPEFEIGLDGKTFFNGNIFDRASNIGDFEVEMTEPVQGKGVLNILLKDGFPARYPYVIKTVELLETSARDFEIAAMPQFLNANKKFALLVEINHPGTKLSVQTSKNISASEKEEQFDKTGLYSLSFTAGDAGLNQFISISDGKRKAKYEINQIVAKKDDRVYISTSDDIYIDKTFRKFSDYIVWYIREGIGNAFCWRPSEQWSDVKVANPEFYERSLGILTDLQMPYSLMIEGRTITGRNINPEEAWMEGPLYMGRQAHENDGGYYYWGHFKWEWLHSDLAAKYRPQGGIFAKNRPIRNENGIFVFYDPFKLRNMEEGPEYFIDNLRKAKGPSIRHTGPSTMFRYLLQAGYDWVGAEQMYGPEEVIMSSIRGACRTYGKDDYGTHLATQWASGPFDTPEHATRLFLSLAISYIHGATHINTEDGLWNTELGIDRFSQSGQEHIKVQRDMLRYIQTHERRGSLVTPLAVFQGRNDGWKCFGRNNVWGQKNEEWNFGPAEESFDLLNVFYPGNKLQPIYKFSTPRSPQGWYSATPFGLIDLLPVEAAPEVLENYKAIAFLGWNTYTDDDFKRLTCFVKSGKTLLLTGAHLNTELVHNRPVIFPVKNKILKELLGENYETATLPYENKVGEGRVIFYPDRKYPIDASIRDKYAESLRETVVKAVEDEKQYGWIENSPYIEFAAWDQEDKSRRTLYLLNIDWWSDTIVHQATLALGGQRFKVDARRNCLETITVSRGVAVMPGSMTTDILEMEFKENQCILTIQTTGEDQLKILFEDHPGIKMLDIKKPGIHKIRVALPGKD